MSNTTQQLQELQQNELVQAALKKALLWLNEPENTTVELLHMGGQGAIFRVESSKYPYPLSIKTPLFNGDYSKQKFRKLILKDWEIQTFGAKTDHTIFPELIYCDPKGDFLIRQYVEGKDLSSVIKKASPEEQLRLFLQVTALTARVFPAFHKNNSDSYILWDYRTKNILYESKKERMYLIDCGSALKEKREIPEKYEKKMPHLGEPDFSAIIPEWLMDEKELVDRRLDFLSYAIIAYRILYNKKPYANRTSDPEEAWKVFHQEYRAAEALIRADERLKQIHPDLVEQLIGCLHPDAHKRFCGKLITP